MRMWMVNPKIMCRKHLMGEHVEIHMLLGSMKRNRNLNGFIENNLLEIKSMYVRHNALVEEMERRGYNHSSSLSLDEVKEVLEQYRGRGLNVAVDRIESKQNLLERCSECRKREMEVYNE